MKRYFYITPEDYDIAEKNGIKQSVVYQRVRHYGWDIDRAIHEPVRVLKDRKKWAAVAKENGIKYHTFLMRITGLGWSEEEAATKPLMDISDVRKKMVNSRRRFPAEMVEKANQNGIKYSTFLSRVKSGWNMEKAATTPVIPPSKRRKGAWHD